MASDLVQLLSTCSSQMKAGEVQQAHSHVPTKAGAARVEAGSKDLGKLGHMANSSLAQVT